MQELQELNQKQLVVIRELSQQQEDNAAQLRAELEAEKEAIRKKIEADLELFRQQRTQQEVCCSSMPGDEDPVSQLEPACTAHTAGGVLLLYVWLCSSCL